MCREFRGDDEYVIRVLIGVAMLERTELKVRFLERRNEERKELCKLGFSWRRKRPRVLGIYKENFQKMATFSNWHTFRK